jgi:sugar lactone lactonase YvrE
MNNITFERVAGPFKSAMGGVTWDGRHILFSLLDDMAIKRFDPETREVTEFRSYVGRVNGIAPGPNGSFFVAQESGRRVIELLADGSARVTATRFNGVIHNHPCDLVVDRQGRIWFSDSHTGIQVFGPKIFPLLDHASVMRIERDDRRAWAIRRITFDTVAPRAVLLSADEKTLYVAEGDVGRSTPRELRAYPVREDGSVGPYRTLHTFGGDPHGPHRGIEGMCLDKQGRVIACGGWTKSGTGPSVMVFDPSGRLVASHAFPGEAPLRCAFGDADGSSLYVSSEEGWLYRASPDVSPVAPIAPLLVW